MYKSRVNSLDRLFDVGTSVYVNQGGDIQAMCLHLSYMRYVLCPQTNKKLIRKYSTPPF